MKRLHHIIEAQQFDREILEFLFETASSMEEIARNGGSDILKGKKMISLFYEPSTRTRISFEMAMYHLGGAVISTENARDFSSAAKGETIEDTIRVLNSYLPDVIVMRHYESGSAKRAALVSDVPIINAGDGPGQHPTQALLDLYTIQKELGQIDGMTVTMVGDLANGRTVRSLCYLLAKFRDIKIRFVSPDVVRMKQDIKDYLDEHNIPYEEIDDLAEAVRDCNVVYQTRIQKERFGDRIEDYYKAKGIYIIDKKIMEIMNKDAIVMHPLPRLDEISTEIDSDPRAAYFRQAQNGLFIRMALLKTIILG